MDPNAAGPYDWREMDRFLQKVWSLLGSFPTSDALNIFGDTLYNPAYTQAVTFAQSSVSADQAQSQGVDATLFWMEV